MVFLASYLAAVLVGGVALAQRENNPDCPTATLTKLPDSCRMTCDYQRCSHHETLINPCGCPSTIPTATLIQACDADDGCPYGGCSFRVETQAPSSCPAPPRPTTPRWPPPPISFSTTPPVSHTTITITTRVTASPPPPSSVSVGVTTLPPPPFSVPFSTVPGPGSSGSSPSVTIGVTTLPSRPLPCPTVTKTSTPADCPALRCPVPTCMEQQTMRVPCGCTPRTRLYIQGCPSSCPDRESCATRVQTSLALCD